MITGMLDPAVLPIVGTVALICVGLCISIARAFLQVREQRRAEYRSAGIWAAFYALAIIGCLVCADMTNLTVSLGFAVTILVLACLVSFGVDRWYRNRDIVGAVAYLQMQQAMRIHPHAPDQVFPVIDSSDDEAESAVPDTVYLCARAARAYDLTRREEEVLGKLLEGMSFASIAGELYVSDNTVKSHVQHIYRKMGVNRKQDLSDKVFTSPSSAENPSLLLL